MCIRLIWGSHHQRFLTTVFGDGRSLWWAARLRGGCLRLHLCRALHVPCVSPACPRVSPVCPRVSPRVPCVSPCVPRVSPECPRVSPACPRVSLCVPGISLCVPACPLRVLKCPLSVPCVSLCVLCMCPGCPCVSRAPWDPWGGCRGGSGAPSSGEPAWAGAEHPPGAPVYLPEGNCRPALFSLVTRLPLRRWFRSSSGIVPLREAASVPPRGGGLFGGCRTCLNTARD